ncbi:hypothetical protein [Arthrobacter sp. TMS1-12-1]
MTDLQCPATAILLAAGAEPPAWLARHRIAATVDLTDPCDVTAVVDETADGFRGETFAVTAPLEAIALALRGWGLRGGPPLVVVIDSEGWRPAP